MSVKRLTSVDLNSIKLNAPLPHGLVDSHGILLAQKGFVFQTESILVSLANRGSGFFVDFSDTSDPDLRLAGRAHTLQLQKRLRDQGALGDWFKFQITYVNLAADESKQKSLDWLELIEVFNAMLRTRDAKFFNRRLESISAILIHQLSLNADEALLALFYLSEKDTRHYSATHGLLVCVICTLTASKILRWSQADIDLLIRCALTMNIGMADLQDDLALQSGPIDMSQAFLISHHANLSVHILEQFGVVDEDWLSIVRLHHKTVAEPLQSESHADRLIGLLNRADIFAAKLARRVSRSAQLPSVAMKSIYIDTNAKTDAMGAAMIKAVGIYRPGSFVKLASGEVGLVIRRNVNSAYPTVAVVLNREGVPVASMATRDTSDRTYAVTANVPSSQVKVTLNLETVLALGR